MEVLITGGYDAAGACVGSNTIAGVGVTTAGFGVGSCTSVERSFVGAGVNIASGYDAPPDCVGDLVTKGAGATVVSDAGATVIGDPVSSSGVAVVSTTVGGVVSLRGASVGGA